MSSISRRKLIYDLGMISGAGLLSARSFGSLKDQKAQRCTTVSQDFYVILAGSWVIVFDRANNLVRAVTVDRNDHNYEYAVTTDNPAVTTPIQPNKTYEVDVQGHKTASPQALVQPMAQKNQGILFNDQVTLSSNRRANLRTISLPMPSEIHPAALIKSLYSVPSHNYSFISVDPTTTQRPTVEQLPGAFAFVYSGWTSASLTLDGTSQRTFNPASGVAHLQFRICPKDACDQPIPCNCAAMGQHEQHAQEAFGDLLGLLNFKSGNKPSINFPPCTGTNSQMTVQLGDDCNISPSEVGMFADSCGRIGNLHTCAASGMIVGS